MTCNLVGVASILFRFVSFLVLPTPPFWESVSTVSFIVHIYMYAVFLLWAKTVGKDDGNEHEGLTLRLLTEATTIN